MRALLEALNDRDCRVRERAARSLFDHLFILDPSFPGDFSLLYQIASDDEHKRSKGIKVVKEWIKEKGYL